MRFLRRLWAERPPEPLGPSDLEPRHSKTERARRRALAREETRRFLAEHPGHPTVEYIVDNRVFLLGLDELYRERMKQHESTELLGCARALAAKLGVSPADVPIEGYYAETQRLTEYFRLVRGLQGVEKNYAGRVSSMREFERLLSVVSAPLYGQPVEDGHLLPVGRDPLAQALLDCDVSRWTLDALTEQAHRVAIQSNDFSLVGLASIARDRVIMAAVRESVALYAEQFTVGGARYQPIPVHVWRVDEELARRSARFVATFNELFDEDLPEPVGENADLFFGAADEVDLIGRCICIGRIPQRRRYYHWTIRRAADGSPAVEEFWDTEIWTTERYARRSRD